MSKQITEGVLSQSLKRRQDLWFVKLQVMPLARTETPADYIVLGKYRYLIECKERKINNNKASFNFCELTQEASLIHFLKKNINNKSYILFNFRQRMKRDSIYYLIDINTYLAAKYATDKKSFNLDDFELFFDDCRILFINKQLDLSRII